MGNRRYPDRPILGVGAVILRDDRVLLVERGNEPLKGYWSLPGGVVEVGETLEEALRREIREETGLAVDIVQVIEVFERIMRDADGRPEYHYVLIDYLCRSYQGTAKPASDASQVGWFSCGEIHALKITEGTPPVIEKAFAAAAKIEE